ncbi:hypothetical protein AB0H76_21365 [Nocardia sp. NPDC050712]|uniref:hypothetical protein n=1 Tax=Nocardia sp. NPDC050712 TaxID=3155518 RepID=UPI00340F4D5A
MIDRSTTRPLDEVSEADYVEQSVPAYPDPAVDSAASDRELAEQVEADAFSANTADVVEQSISVPLDDEYRGDADAGAEGSGAEYTEEI